MPTIELMVKPPGRNRFGDAVRSADAECQHVRALFETGLNELGGDGISTKWRGALKSRGL
jgi:hypothetical protein